MPSKGPKLWLQERWVLLDQALTQLTVEQEDEIKRLCEEELAYFRNERKLALSTLGSSVSLTRGHIEECFTALDETNSWYNPREGKREHIALKYMNLSKEEWAERAVPGEEIREARLQDRKFIADPDAVVARAVSLLTSDYWQDITVALAVLTGRRLHEVLEVGSFSLRTRYTLTFTGQLKTAQVMAPYEIPSLCEAALVVAAADRLRLLVADVPVNENSLGGVADKHFADIVPPRSGGSLYTHLFRAVYGCIAVFFYCPPRIVDFIYLNRIYGHYWILEATGKLQADYASTQHYQDYAIADSVILAHAGQRQGVKEKDTGVEILDVFKEKPEAQSKRGSRKVKAEEMTKEPSKTGYSMIKPRQETKLRVDQFIDEENITDSSPYDAALTLLLKRNYEAKTLTGYASLEDIAALLADAARASEKPVAYLAELIKIKATYDALTSYSASLEDITTLLADAAKDNKEPVKYLNEVLNQKRNFKAGYDARVHGKDYKAMKTSDLRKHKAPEAAAERFDRAIAAIMEYNATVALPEARWFISPAVLIDLVGGSPAGAKAHIEARPEVAKYHEDNKLKPGINRRGVPITERITVPELPSQPASEEVAEEVATE